VIETERLVLRLPRREDVPAAIRYYRANREHLQPWSPIYPANFYTEEYWQDQVAQRAAELSAGQAARFLVFAKSGPGEVIGNASLTEVQRGVAQFAVLGYGIAAAAEGRGLMTEAVRGVVGYAFGELGLHRVMAAYMPHNRRSAAVLRRLGFRVEGYAYDYILINGRWEDHVLTGLVNADWTA